MDDCILVIVDDFVSDDQTQGAATTCSRSSAVRFGLELVMGLSVLQLVVGYRTLAELEHAYPDCQILSDQARVLLTVLFPKMPSRVWPVD
jgi:hypothetical protein